MYTTYQNEITGDGASATESLLSEFKAFPNQDRRTTSVDTVSLTSNVEIERNTTTSLGYVNNPLERDFSRVPAYIEGSNSPPLFGYVMRDLANRFLAPSSAQQSRRQLLKEQFAPSKILVACPRANEVLSQIKEEDLTTVDSKKELIKSLGYGIGKSFLVETIFNGHDAIPMDSDTGILQGDVAESTDILLAVLDPAAGQENSVISSVLEKLIRSGSIEYATFRISGSIPKQYLFYDISKKRGVVEMQGVEASKMFLAAGYKLQVLSSSHVPTDGLNPFGPNTLLKNVEDVKGFLTFGSDLAKKAEFTHLSKIVSKNLTLLSQNTDKPMTFHSVLFATRSLDLAIPSRKAFLDLNGMTNDFILDVEKDGVPLPDCTTSTLKYSRNKDRHFKITCFGASFTMDERHKTTEVDESTISAELWYSHQNYSLSEAICLKCTKSSINNNEQSVTESECRSRFPYPSVANSPPQSSHYQRKGKRNPNLVAIELKGINQNAVNTFLARFKAFSGSLGLDYFPNFVRSTYLEMKDDDREWWKVWDDFIEDGAYQRYRGSNQCDLSSNGEEDNSTHYRGNQMSRMFCFDYDRPNCLGSKQTSVHLFDHTRRFISHSSRQNERWVTYITLIDGTEESETLAAGLDLPLRNFLQRLRDQMTGDEWSETVITVFSQDVEEPILFLKAGADEIQLLKDQQSLYTSDLHMIMRSILNNGVTESLFHTDLAPERLTSKAYAFGAEKTVEKNTSTNESEVVTPPSILSFYADIPKEHKLKLVKPSTEQIMKRAKVFKGCSCATTRSHWAPCDVHPWERRRFDDRETFILVDCPGQPLHLEIKIGENQQLLKRSSSKRAISKMYDVEKINIVFLEIDSASQQYADRHFPKTRELLKEYRIKQSGETEYDCMDGICSAEFTHGSLVGANSIPNQVAALSGCITATTEDLCGFDLINEMGFPAVVENRGKLCDDTGSIHYGFRFQTAQLAMNVSYWCPDRDLSVTKTPWLFGVSDSKGYINFFGEEFCYNHSPYVTQGTST